MIAALQVPSPEDNIPAYEITHFTQEREGRAAFHWRPNFPDQSASFRLKLIGAGDLRNPLLDWR
jgi:hypothetical protein